jgi:hypothetical protein
MPLPVFAMVGANLAVPLRMTAEDTADKSTVSSCTSGTSNSSAATITIRLGPEPPAKGPV